MEIYWLHTTIKSKIKTAPEKERFIQLVIKNNQSKIN